MNIFCVMFELASLWNTLQNAFDQYANIYHVRWNANSQMITKDE